MPPLPAIAKVIKVEFVGRFGDSTWANIMHVQYAGAAPSVADLQGLAFTLGTDYNNRFKAFQSTALTLDEVVATDLTSSTAAEAIEPIGLTGASATAIKPAQLAACISWHIARRYRGGHPRTYLGGLTADIDSTEKNFDVTTVGTLKAHATSFIADVNATVQGAVGPFTFGSVSYRTGNAPRVAPIFDPILAASVTIRHCSQRRRSGKEPR